MPTFSAALNIPKAKQEQLWVTVLFAHDWVPTFKASNIPMNLYAQGMAENYH